MSLPRHKLKVTPGIGMTKDGTTENQVHQPGQVMMILRMINSFPVKNPVITTPFEKSFFPNMKQLFPCKSCIQKKDIHLFIEFWCDTGVSI